MARMVLIFRYDPADIMKKSLKSYLIATVTILFLAAGSLASAHPGPPGHHHHPDEVDEFDESSMTVPAEQRSFDAGGIVIIAIVSGCLIFAFFQKEGGIWRDVTLHH